jgi:predicted nucleic acid-binding protein
MINYLDTSALVKRYVAEPGSAAVRPLFRSRAVATVRIAYAELAATLARLAREGALAETARTRIVGRLDRDFAAMTVVEVRATLVRRVPALVARCPLRGYDAVHLAAALVIREQGAAVTFWAADGGLVAAAKAEGLRATLLP